MSESVIPGKRLPTLQRTLLFLVLPVIVYYIYDQFQDGWDKLEQYQWSLDFTQFILSVLLAIAYFIFTSWIWHRLLFYMGAEIGFQSSFRILQLAQLGKYLPGRIWAMGGQVYLGEREGIPSSTMLWALGLQWFFNLLSGAIIFIPFLYLLVPLWLTVCTTAFLLFLLGLGFFPHHIRRFILSWIKSKNTERVSMALLRISPRQSLIIFSSFVFAWLIFGFAFWAMINAFTEVPLSGYFDALASFCGAWVVGVLSFFTPAGIGVREGALIYLLGQFLPPSMAVIISIAARLWLTLVELICAAVAWFL